MCADTSEYSRAIKLSMGRFWDYYWQSKSRYAAITLAPALSAASGFVEPKHSGTLNLLAVVLIALSLGFVYVSGRPFGINISWTPTHSVNGTREPDTASEKRGNILLQEDTNKLHGQVELSRLTRSFELEFDGSDGVDIELESIPNSEHEYDPKENVLKCSSVSEYQFPMKVNAYPGREVSQAGRYHSLKIRDKQSDRVLQEFDVINVRG